MARRFQLKGAIASQEATTIPDLQIGDLTTEEGIAKTLQGISESAAKIRNANLKRLAEVRQCCNVAVGLRQASATRELNNTLLRLEHGGKAVQILEQLRNNRNIRPLAEVVDMKPGGTRGQ
ncbi:hypothetical protein W02_38300 [Nitrospira sp. KM1]|nr:hypothetical protein W02_38300 [Nitrospira sp. KM1]